MYTTTLAGHAVEFLALIVFLGALAIPTYAEYRRKNKPVDAKPSGATKI